jgi:spore germination cell wall hydrolase CwlJ-like protein
MKLHGWSALPLAVICWLCLPASSQAKETHREAADCLALALYWEARAEGPEGMLAVASVVLNRVAHPEFPDTICEVVKQGGEQPPCQFSWWCDGLSDQPTETETWQLAQNLARRCLSKEPRDLTRGALFFHASSIDAPWQRPRQRTVQIGGHVFYR